VPGACCITPGPLTCGAGAREIDGLVVRVNKVTIDYDRADQTNACRAGAMESFY
jgi:hypothetical protein